MLFDQVLAQDTSEMPPPYRGEIEALKRGVAAAQHFVLDPTMAHAADALTREDVIRAVPWCKPPFERCWFEAAHAERPKFNAKPIAPGLIRPKRVGVLIEPAQDLGKGLYDVALVWDCPPAVATTGERLGDISVCAVSAVVNLGGESTEWNEALKFLATPGNPDMGGINDGPPLPFAFTATRRYSGESVGTVILHDPRLANEMLLSAIGDWGGEPWFWMAVLGLINAKGGASVEAGEDRSRLNRARERSGKPALKPFHVLKVKVGSGKSGAPLAGENAHRDLRRHVVRGHFKARKSGLYWWSPHMRGDLAKGFAAKRYDLTGAKR
jgi:hypothetical protein